MDTTTRREARLAVALRRLLMATSHSTDLSSVDPDLAEQSETWWDVMSESALEDGKTSSDYRRAAARLAVEALRG